MYCKGDAERDQFLLDFLKFVEVRQQYWGVGQKEVVALKEGFMAGSGIKF